MIYNRTLKLAIRVNEEWQICALVEAIMERNTNALMDIAINTIVEFGELSEGGLVSV